jgi:hypothetical protein
VETEPERTAQLTGTGKRIFEELGAVALRGDHVVFETNEATARAKLGDEAYEAATARGREMALGDAVAYARAGSRK